MSFDVTYCNAACGNVKCIFHKSKARECIEFKGFASFADRSKDCINFRREIKNK